MRKTSIVLASLLFVLGGCSFNVASQSKSLNQVAPANKVAPSSQENCNKITDQIDKFSCVTQKAVAAGDFKLCDDLIRSSEYDSMDRDACYYEVAIKTKSIEICNIIVNQREKDMCYFANAKTEETCDIIITPSSKVQCFSKINPKKITDQLCSSIDKNENGGHEYNTCYYDLAILNDNPDLCKKMITASADQCFFKFAQNKLDLKYCDMMVTQTGSGSKNHCISTIGSLTKNPKVCDSIIDELERKSCYENVPY